MYLYICVFNKSGFLCFSERHYINLVLKLSLYDRICCVCYLSTWTHAAEHAFIILCKMYYVFYGLAHLFCIFYLSETNNNDARNSCNAQKKLHHRTHIPRDRPKSTTPQMSSSRRRSVHIRTCICIYVMYTMYCIYM